MTSYKPVRVTVEVVFRPVTEDWDTAMAIARGSTLAALSGYGAHSVSIVTVVPDPIDG